MVPNFSSAVASQMQASEPDIGCLPLRSVGGARFHQSAVFGSLRGVLALTTNVSVHSCLFNRLFGQPDFFSFLVSYTPLARKHSQALDSRRRTPSVERLQFQHACQIENCCAER